MCKVIGIMAVGIAFMLAPATVPQGARDAEAPVWTMQVLEVKPGMFGLALGKLDDTWMRVREEAKREGIVVSYNRIAERTGDSSARHILLLTEFRNEASWRKSDKLLGEIEARLPKDTTAVFRARPDEEIYTSKSIRVFEDYSEREETRLKPLARY